MSVNEDRVTARLGPWTPPSKYNQPHLEPRGGIRTKEHKVLADVTVIQKLGEDVERFTLRGDAYAEDISELRELKGEEVELRHTVHSGDVLVTDVSASHTSSWDRENGVRRWVYTYTISLLRLV